MTQVVVKTFEAVWAINVPNRNSRIDVLYSICPLSFLALYLRELKSFEGERHERYEPVHSMVVLIDMHLLFKVFWPIKLTIALLAKHHIDNLHG